MIRIVARLALFLLVGAACTLAVAWMFCLVAPTTSENLVIADWQERFPEAKPIPNNGVIFADLYLERSAGCDYTLELITQGQDSPFGGLRAILAQRVSCRAGWPLRAFEGEVPGILRTSASGPRGHFDLAEEHVGAFAVPWIGGARRALPYGPLWQGLAVNIALYGVAVFVLARAPSAVRAALRRRRGQCTACGYPVGAAATCTECGQPLPVAHGATS